MMPSTRSWTLVQLLLALALLGILLAAGAASLRHGLAKAAEPLYGILTPTAGDVEIALAKTGITPETLAAAGATAQETAAIVQAMNEALTLDPDLLSAPEGSLHTSKTTADRLQRRIRSGQATDQEIQNGQQAVLDEAEDRATRDAVLNQLFDDLDDELATATATRLAVIRGHARWDAPVEFKVVQRSAADWVRLRHALANERIAEKDGVDPDPEDQTYLQNQRSEPDVALATTNLENNLDTIQQAWNNNLPE